MDLEEGRGLVLDGKVVARLVAVEDGKQPEEALLVADGRNRAGAVASPGHGAEGVGGQQRRRDEGAVRCSVGLRRPWPGRRLRVHRRQGKEGVGAADAGQLSGGHSV